MLLRLSLSLLVASIAAASTLQSRTQLQKRDDTVCADLTVSSNNGDRKVAIVLDSSGSMVYNDPDDLRIKAGRALNDFLISSSEAGGNQKADLVTVIDFDYVATLDYPLGDPGGANSSFDKVDALGGTYIAAGVNLAIAQLTGGGGTTDKRSAIVVFTDGEDYNTDELVDAINNATAAGIRVSFGFLDTSASTQPSEVLSAVKNSRGVYATITVAAGSQNFINYVLLNGLTYNDNPQGYDSQLLAGLAETQFITGSNTVTLKYSAQKDEHVNFTITSISAGFLDIAATMGGKTLNTTNTTYSYETIYVTAPNSGEIELKITAKAAPSDAMFSVITNSNVPFKNCTVGVSGGSGHGLTSGAKAGVAIGVIAAVLGLGGLGGYFAYKHFMGGGGGGNAVPPSGGESNPAQFAPSGTEKMMAHTDVYPMDPGSHSMAPDPGSHGLTGPPNGYEAPMSGPPAPQTGAPNLAPSGQGGFAPPSGQGGIPPVNAPMGPSGAPLSTPPMSSVPPTGAPMSSSLPTGAPMSSVPPTGASMSSSLPTGAPMSSSLPSGAPMSSVPPTGASTGSILPTGAPSYPGSPPTVFIPPLVPPNAFSGNHIAPNNGNSKGPNGPQAQGGPQPQQGDAQYHGMNQYPGVSSGQPMAPGAQQVIGNGVIQPISPGSHAPPGAMGPPGYGAYPPAPSSQTPFGYGPDAHTVSSPGLQHMSGPDSLQHNAAPNAYQSPLGQGNTSLGPGNNYQSFSNPGGQATPMSGADSYHHHPSPSPQYTGSSPYTSPPGPSSTAPPVNSTTPHTAGAVPSGGDSLHPHPQGNDLSPPDPSSQAQPGASGGDLTHPDWTDYHDPDSCSCSEGPGPDSDVEDGRDPSQPGTNSTGPGFYVPGAPYRAPDRQGRRHRHRRRRFPRLARSRVEKHHHHAWLGRDVECTDNECVFNRADHVCVERGCECKCRDDECEVYKRKLSERRHRDGGLVAALNATS